MLRITIIAALILSLIVIIIGCSTTPSVPSPAQTPDPSPIPEPSPTPTPAPDPTPAPTPKPKPPSGPIKAKWITAEVDNNTASIAVKEVQDNWNTHFKIKTQGGELNYMAYMLDGQIYVRANVCPPCRSIGFSLKGNILVCDRCATTFEAKTGKGIKGACVDFPKESVPYKIIDGSVVMNGSDLVAAYQNTINPG